MDDDREWKLRYLTLEHRALRAIVVRMMAASLLPLASRADFFLSDESIGEMLDPIAETADEHKFISSYWLNIVREAHELIGGVDVVPPESPGDQPKLKIVKNEDDEEER